jgi:hypothetical protein
MACDINTFNVSTSSFFALKKHRSPDAVIYSFLQAGGSAESIERSVPYE